MRILHTADWHLGRTLHGADLLPSQAAFLDHLVETTARERVSAVVVAGDVYDRAYPPLEAVELLESALVRLTEHAHVVLIPGNHDSATRLGFGSPLFRERLHVCTRPLASGFPLLIPDADGADSALIYAVPYLDPDAARVVLAPWGEPDADGVPAPLGRSHESVMAAVMRQVGPDLARRRRESSNRTPAVLVAHAFVGGGAVSDSERDIRVGGVDAVPHPVFGDDLDYVALGHLHRGQRVGPLEGPGPRLRYAGSPVAYSFSEASDRKASVLVTLGGGAAGATTEAVEAPVTRRLSELSGSLEELLGRRFEAQRSDWVRVSVVEARRPDDLVATVKRAFPYALQVLFEPLGGRVPLVGAAREASDPLRVLEDFVTSVSNCPATERELAVLGQAYEAVRAGEGSR